MDRGPEQVGVRAGCSIAAIGLLTLAPSLASASFIAPASGGDARVDEVRLAHVASPGRSVLFEQLSLTDVRGETAWIVQVPEGGFVEPAGAQLFSALELATAPVLAPAPSLQCGALLRSTADELAGLPPRPVSRSLGSSAAREAPDRLAAAGFVPSDATRKALLALGAEPVTILVLAAGVAGPTAAIRVVSGPRATVAAGLAGPSLRFFGLASARVRLPGEVEPAFGALTWGASGTNWTSLLDAARTDAAALGGQVLTFAAREGIFSDQALPAGATLPSVLRRYYGEAEACVGRASSLALRPTPLEVPCPRTPPWPGATPAPACVPSPGAVDQLVCDGADDLAAAFANTAPAQLWLTRFVGHVAEPLAPTAAAWSSLPSFHQVSLAGTPTCAPSTPGTPPTTPPAEPPPTPVVDDQAAEACGAMGSALAEGCAASADDGSCAGSSEGSSEDSASGCSGSDTGSSEGADGCRVSTPRVRLRAWPVAYALVALAFFARRRGRRGP